MFSFYFCWSPSTVLGWDSNSLGFGPVEIKLHFASDLLIDTDKLIMDFLSVISYSLRMLLNTPSRKALPVTEEPKKAKTYVPFPGECLISQQ